MPQIDDQINHICQGRYTCRSCRAGPLTACSGLDDAVASSWQQPCVYSGVRVCPKAGVADAMVVQKPRALRAERCVVAHICCMTPQRASRNMKKMSASILAGWKMRASTWNWTAWVQLSHRSVASPAALLSRTCAFTSSLSTSCPLPPHKPILCGRCRCAVLMSL